MNKWLDRSLLAGPYYCLCLSEKALHKELKNLGLPLNEWPGFIKRSSYATTHFFTNDGKECAIVCLGSTKGFTGIQVAAIICHEAVHVWQYFRRSIGEDKPGDETEAYAIQTITQRLMESYREQTRRRVCI